MSIGTSVRLLRESQRITQEHLAERLGISQSRISAIESDKYGEGYSLRTLHNLAEALGAELVVRFKVKGGWHDSDSRSLGHQPREELTSEQKSEEGRPVKHESRRNEVVETLFQQTSSSTFQRDTARLCGLRRAYYANAE